MYLGQFLLLLSFFLANKSNFFAEGTSSIFRVGKDFAIKSGVIGSTGVLIFGDTTLLGAKKWVFPQQFLVRYFQSIYEKSNTFQQLLNTHFKALGDLRSYGSLNTNQRLPPHCINTN